MKRGLKNVALFASVLAIGATAWVFKDAIPPRGAITEGARFDVLVGARYEDAHRTLVSKGYRSFSSEAGGLCVFRRFDAQLTVHKFNAPGWRRGTLCLVEDKGEVHEIVWAFDLVRGFL